MLFKYYSAKQNLGEYGCKSESSTREYADIKNGLRQS